MNKNIIFKIPLKEKKVKQIKNIKYQISAKIFLMLCKSPIRKTFLSLKSNIQ